MAQHKLLRLYKTTPQFNPVPDIAVRLYRRFGKIPVSDTGIYPHTEQVAEKLILILAGFNIGINQPARMCTLSVRSGIELPWF